MGAGDASAVVQYLRSPATLAAFIAGAAAVYPVVMFFFWKRLKAQECRIETLTEQKDDLLERLAEQRLEFKKFMLDQEFTIAKLRSDLAELRSALKRAGR